MKASEVMTKNPVTVNPEVGIADVIKLIRKTRHDGFPVVQENKVVGFITYDDIVLQPLTKEEHDYTKLLASALAKKVADVMRRRVIAVLPEMEIEAIARLMFRTGHSRFPVVDEEGNLLGLITNTDVIRAHIERVTPLKVETLKKTIETLHEIKITVTEEDLPLKELIPTQAKIYKDELAAREYEIKLGLAEPLLVIQNGNRYVLVDGHHRALGASRAGVEKMHAYVLKLEREIELGLEKTAEKMGLKKLEDIEVLDGLSPYTLPVVLENGQVKKLV